LPASSGMISGVGLAIANTIASRCMAPRSSTFTTPGPLRPMNTSAPTIASRTVPRMLSALVCSANHVFIGFMFSVRPR